MTKQALDVPEQASPAKRVLVIANRTASTPRLLDEISRRAKEAPTQFTLLVPDVHNRRVPDWTLEVALRLMRQSAGRPVSHFAGSFDPFTAVQAAVRNHEFDEIIISTRPKRTSKWLRRDLIHRVQRLGLPVTTVVARQKSTLQQLEDSLEFSNAIGLSLGGGAVMSRKRH